VCVLTAVSCFPCSFERCSYRVSDVPNVAAVRIKRLPRTNYQALSSFVRRRIDGRLPWDPSTGLFDPRERLQARRWNRGLFRERCKSASACCHRRRYCHCYCILCRRAVPSVLSASRPDNARRSYVGERGRSPKRKRFFATEILVDCWQA
jgi:hypothetical protein